MAFFKKQTWLLRRGYNPPVTITVNETEHTVENGKETTIELEKNKVYLLTFSYPKYNKRVTLINFT